MMVATFNSNASTTIISCYSPTNISEETDLIVFYNLVPNISKHNVLVIGGDMNVRIGKNVNHKVSLHKLSNRNGEHLTSFALENRFKCLNTKFQKSKGKLWTNTYLINKKWNNSALNCVAYSSFDGMSSNHRTVTAKI